MTASLSGEFFDDFYAGRTDPWGFTDRWYESRKRSITLAALPRARFRSAFEPGCSIGVLTRDLAGRCDAVLSTDISAAPLETARQRLADSPHVNFEQLRIPDDWPAGTFDLIVLSEIAYYCGDADLLELADRARASLAPDGVLLLCHWRHRVDAYPQTGDEVHRIIRARTGLERLGGYDDADFLLDVLVPGPATSVGAAEGLA